MRRLGFTLVELSIVLVIIGLLIGGVLVGRSLIQNAKINNLVTEYYQYEAMINAFKSKYNYVPGDDPYFPGLGNGDGAVAGTNSLGGYEPCYVWKHLSQAGFLKAAITIQDSIRCKNGLDGPGSKYSKDVYWQFMSSKSAGFLYFVGEENSVNYFVVGAGKYNEGCWVNGATSINCGSHSGMINAVSVLALDIKIDDGSPITGNLLATNSGSDGQQSSPWAGTSRYCLYNNGGTWTYYTGYTQDYGACMVLIKPNIY